MKNAKIKIKMVNEYGYIENVEVCSKRYYEILCIRYEREKQELEELKRVRQQAFDLNELVWEKKRLMTKHGVEALNMLKSEVVENGVQVYSR